MARNEFRFGGSFETENKVDRLVVADLNFDGLDDVTNVGDRRIEGAFLFGNSLSDTIEPNRVHVCANDGLEGLVEVENVPDVSPFDIDLCKGPNNCVCAASSPGPTACQTTRTWAMARKVGSWRPELR